MKRWPAILAMLVASAHASPQKGGCATSMAAAVEHFVADQMQTGAHDGYRVVAVRRDGLRQRVWLMVERCGHPQVPLTAVSLSSDRSLPSVLGRESTPVVHIGDEVSIVARSGSSQMQLHGWAEESGAVAARIRVRLPRVSAEEGQAMPKIICVVTGAGRAEVVE